MAFPFLLLFVAMAFVFPAEIVPALAPYRIPFWVGNIGLVLVILSVAFRRIAPIRTLQFWFLIAFTLIVVVSQMVGERWFGAAVPAFIRFAPSVAMFMLAMCAIDSLPKLRIIAACIVLASLAVVAQGVAAYHYGYKTDMFLLNPMTRGDENPDAQQLEGESKAVRAQADLTGTTTDVTADDGNDDIDGSLAFRIRGLGMLHDPNDLAAALVFAMPLLWAAWRTKALLRNALLVVVPSIVLAYGIFLTRSRGGAFALAVMLSIAIGRRMGRLAAVCLLAVLLAGGLASDFASGRPISLNDDSSTGRLNAWSEGLQMLKGAPVLGVGFGQFTERNEITAHNSLVLCFAETGLLGYFFWIGLLVVTFKQLRSIQKIRGESQEDRSLVKWAGTLEMAMIGFMIAAFFLSRTFVPMLYLVIGLCIALIVVARQQDRPVWSPSVPSLGGLILASEFGSILSIYILVKFYMTLLRS